MAGMDARAARAWGAHGAMVQPVEGLDHWEEHEADLSRPRRWARPRNATTSKTTGAIVILVQTRTCAAVAAGNH
jgi:hypothetical protein